MQHNNIVPLPQKKFQDFVKHWQKNINPSHFDQMNHFTHVFKLTFTHRPLHCGWLYAFEYILLYICAPSAFTLAKERRQVNEHQLYTKLSINDHGALIPCLLFVWCSNTVRYCVHLLGATALSPSQCRYLKDTGWLKFFFPTTGFSHTCANLHLLLKGKYFHTDNRTVWEVMYIFSIVSYYLDDAH